MVGGSVADWSRTLLLIGAAVLVVACQNSQARPKVQSKTSPTRHSG